MKVKNFFAVSALMLTGISASAAPIELIINNYTSNSVTFTLTGTMPSSAPPALQDGPSEIDINYSGNLWTGGDNYSANSLSATPFSSGPSFQFGNTGGFGSTTNYSWLHFSSSLLGVTGSGAPVTLTWHGANYLNPTGTGSFDLYLGNLYIGPDSTGVNNVLLSSAAVVDGQIVGGTVPEPTTVALLGLGILGFTISRRKSAK